MTRQKYILHLLKDTKLLQCHTNDTPIESNHKLTLNENNPNIGKSSYKNLVRRLLYLLLGSKVDKPSKILIKILNAAKHIESDIQN